MEIDATQEQAELVMIELNEIEEKKQFDRIIKKLDKIEKVTSNLVKKINK